MDLKKERYPRIKKNIKDIKPILNEIKEKLQKMYGKRLNGIILIGSYSRGDATEDSDIDVVLLLRDMKYPDEEIIKSSNALGDLELNYDTLISLIPIDNNDFIERHLPIILNAEKEGIRI